MSSIEDILKINAFARRCQLDVDTISEILKGNTKNPGVHTIARIADALDCSIDELIADSNTELKIQLARSCITTTVDLLRQENQKISLDEFLRKTCCGIVKTEDLLGNSTAVI